MMGVAASPSRTCIAPRWSVTPRRRSSRLAPTHIGWITARAGLAHICRDDEGARYRTGLTGFRPPDNFPSGIWLICGKDDDMAWKTLKILEVPLGAELNAYACADLKK
jgi:hypothetical protein